MDPKSPFDFYDVAVAGGSVFLDECRRTEFLGELLSPDGAIRYHSTILTGDIKDVAVWNQGIQKDIVTLTSVARDAALTRADIKRELASVMDKRQADEAASFLGDKQGAAFIRSITAVLQGHEEPLEQLLRCDRQLAILNKRLSREGIEWFFGQRLAKVGVVAIDSSKLWLVQARTASAVVEQMCSTLLPVAGRAIAS